MWDHFCEDTQKVVKINLILNYAQTILFKKLIKINLKLWKTIEEKVIKKTMKGTLKFKKKFKRQNSCEKYFWESERMKNCIILKSIEVLNKI